MTVNTAPISSERFLNYLRQKFKIKNISFSEPLQQISADQENYVAKFRLQGGPEFLQGQLVLKIYTSTTTFQNVEWQGRVQNAVAIEQLAPKTYLACDDSAVLGAAFIVCDYIAGKPLNSQRFVSSTQVLASTQAKLHAIDPSILMNEVQTKSYDPMFHGMARRYRFLESHAEQFSELADIVFWLLDNRPVKPKELSICHMNLQENCLLVENNRINGITHWSEAIVADPTYDVANTLTRITITARYGHLASNYQLQPTDKKLALKNIEADELHVLYLATYQRLRSFDLQNLGYYRVFCCLSSLLRQTYTQPQIVDDLIDQIHLISNISLHDFFSYKPSTSEPSSWVSEFEEATPA